MEINKFCYIIIASILFSFEIGFAKRNETELNWNKTDRILPIYVQDSIQNFYKSINIDYCIYFLYGKGINEDKENPDGIYSFKMLSSHSHTHLLIIYHSEVYIVKSLNHGGIVAEICRFAKKKNIDEAFLKEACLICFNYLLDEHQTTDDEKNIEFVNKDDFVRSLLFSKSMDEVYKVYKEIKYSKNIAEDFPFYILTKELDEKETILLLGLIGGYDFEHESNEIER
ncbi:hypothetical protein [Prevotella sp. lc2012]|uniref:hypothetical protein n=1 Tax=Prevotella sp. lc2012 TaxID=1761886 RepID=UPI000895C2B3|nr:hypothetical protein [Prevotella sp. lc2012]SED99418.1 hypothetical protein SAMN04487828_0094 [Prevotella sp. lc2012]